MTEVLNEVASRGEPDQFAPSSDISLRVVSQKSVPSAASTGTPPVRAVLGCRFATRKFGESPAQH
jgi:hypothetical protein